MNDYLLILGAGGLGRVVKETAEAMGVFGRIDFLDDNPDCKEAIGLCADCEKLAKVYGCAFPAFGNGKSRMKWMEKLEKCYYKVPVLVHPTAFVSPSAVIRQGTIVEAKAAINANSVIEKGCIISMGAIIDHDSFISYGCNIDCGAIIKSIYIDAFTKAECGSILSRSYALTPQKLRETNEYSFEAGV